MSSAIKRLSKDYLQYKENENDFTLISAKPLENNLFEWHVNICAPDGPYANLPLHFILKFPENYPAAPPDVRLCSRIDHPNVFGEWDGTDAAWICLDMLKEYTVKTKYEGWSSVYTVQSILLQLQSFLFSENVPQDYGGSQNLELGNCSVVSSINRIKKFRCPCGHCIEKPSPALPKAYYKLLNTSVWKSGAKIVAEKGAVINQNTVFWQQFPKWKKAAWDCGTLLTDIHCHKLQYEVKIDWGWNDYYREDIRIGWGVIDRERVPCDTATLKYKVIDESPADVGVWFWPENLKVGDVLTTAIDLQRKKVWYGVNGKLLPVRSYTSGLNEGEHLVPVFQFRACRLLLNFDTPTKLIPRFRDAGFKLLEPKLPVPLPNVQIQEWKDDKDASADVFPPQVFQVMVEFLPMGDIINARASCESVRSLIEECAIIPRREVHCFVTKQTWKEATLGVGLSCTKNEKKFTLEEVQPNMEFLSLEKWKAGHNMSAWGEELTNFLVLPISRTHCNIDLIIKYLEKFGAEYRLGGGHSAPEILNILSKLMNMCVVSMMKETEGGKCNEKLLVGYTQFHHLLLALNGRFPEVAELAQKRLHNFVNKESARHKSETPDVGKLLVMASLCPDLDWKKFMKTLFVEVSRRRVLWYLKECGSLANIDASDDAYCQRVFELTEISRGVVAFQVAFLKIFALPKGGETLEDVLSKYYLRYGQPRSADMSAFFKRAQEIVKCKTWKEHLNQVDMAEMSGTELAHYLKSAVGQSLKAGYHRRERHHGRGTVSSTKGNPACFGLFRMAKKQAKDLSNRATFYLPSQYFHKVKAICKEIGATVSLPGKPFTGPITVASNSQETVKAAKKALKAAFPRLSLSPLKREFFELSFDDVNAYERQLMQIARQLCVSAKFPKKFAFPLATVTGSQSSIQQFHLAMQNTLRKPIVTKFSLKEHQLCKRCDMTFPGFHGATVKNLKSGPMQVTLKANTEKAWGGYYDRASMRIQSIVTGELFDKLGLEEGMKITDVKPDMDHFSQGKACSFTAMHECGFLCRFCWPQFQKENQCFTREAKLRVIIKRRAIERKQREEQRAKAIQQKVASAGAKGSKFQFPATFMTRRLAQVRKGDCLQSEKVTELPAQTFVEVHEVCGNRARISSPAKGWVSIVTKRGLLLDLRVENMIAFPMLGAKTIHKEAKTSYKDMKKPSIADKAKKTVKKADWDCQVCGATGCFASRTHCFKCNAPRGQSKVQHDKQVQKNNVDILSSSSSESGSSKSFTVATKAAVRYVKSGKTYVTLRAAAIREGKDKASPFVANLQKNDRVYVGHVDHKNLRARISSPYRGWISTWTQKGRLLK